MNMIEIKHETRHYTQSYLRLCARNIFIRIHKAKKKAEIRERRRNHQSINRRKLRWYFREVLDRYRSTDSWLTTNFILSLLILCCALDYWSTRKGINVDVWNTKPQCSASVLAEMRVRLFSSALYFFPFHLWCSVNKNDSEEQKKRKLKFKFQWDEELLVLSLSSTTTQ